MMHVIGLDEVGRGPLAGPVVTGGVILPHNIKDLLFNTRVIIRDSKTMSHKQRVEASQWIYEHSLAVGIGVCEVSGINTLGIVPATNRAFRKSVKAITTKFTGQIEYLLIDAFFIPKIPGFPKSKQKAIIRGDSQVLAISAASIVAKVYRDQLMTDLGLAPEFQYYRWEENKGYGTKQHCDAIRKYGTTQHHRDLFVRKLMK